MTYRPPSGAILTAFMGTGADGKGVALYDVSHLIPRWEPWPRRPLEDVTRQYVHHSGILRQGDPFEHLCSSARFSVRSRGWAGTGYHTWLPYFDVFDDDGCRVVYLCNHPDRRTAHAGKKGAGRPNDVGLAHCLQGNTTQRKLSAAQLSTLPVTLQHFAGELAITGGVLGHFQAVDGNPKESCPGMAAESWVLGYQAGRHSRKHQSPWA